MDGTLLDSMPMWKHVASNYLLSQGLLPDKDTDAHFQSLSLPQAARLFQKEYGSSKSVDSIIHEINQMVADQYRHRVPLKPGAKEFLKELRDREIPVCVATATDRMQVQAAFDRLSIAEYISNIFTCTEVGHGKDEPDIYEAALQFLNMPKENVLVFEDALYAIRTAKAAGFQVAAIQDACETKNEAEIRSLADYYFQDFQKGKELLR